MHNPNCPNCLNWSTFSFPRCLPSLRIAQIRNFWQIRDQWNTDKWFRPVSGGSWYEHPLQEIWRVHAGHLHSYLHWFQSHLLMLCQVSMGVQKIFLNPIPLDILRFRVKTMPQIKAKEQGAPNMLLMYRSQGRSKSWTLICGGFPSSFINGLQVKHHPISDHLF